MTVFDRVSPPRRRRFIRLAAGVLAILWTLLFTYHLLKPLPEGISVSGPERSAEGMEFLADLTFQGGGQQGAGREVVDQQIFDRVLSMIDAAEDFVVIDMFLFNGGHDGERDYRPLSEELTNHLILKKASNPDLDLIFITDEINNLYGAYTGPEIARLQAAGVEVVLTRMTRLRDSNPVYSAGWRMLVGWLGTGGPGWLPDVINRSGQKVTARAYLKLLNLKANHRKIIVTDKECLVTSANPHDGSSLHSNIAFVGTGPLCADLLEAERAVAAFSASSVVEWPTLSVAHMVNGVPETGTSLPGPGNSEAPPGAGSVQLLTEGKILDALLEEVASAGKGDRVDLAMFYLSERRVVKALMEAAGRGASVRLVLDPNKDAFGREKGGIPNRQVARELVTRSGNRIKVRWYDTRGEQFHTKLMVVTRGDSVTIMGGSANLTRRNLRDFNLEADLRFVLPRGASLAYSVSTYFETVFANEGGEYTLPFDAYRDDSFLKRIRYRLEEFTGFCSY